MQGLVNLFGQGATDPGHAAQVVHGGGADAVQAAEMGQQLAPSGRADTGHVLQGGAAAGLGAPGAVAEAKRVLRRLGPVIDDAVIAATIDALVARWDSPEAAEGIAAFFARRKPVWGG